MKNFIAYKTILCTALLCLGGIQANAQLPKIFGKPVNSVNPANGIIRCATTEYEAWLQEQNPKRETREHFEAWLAEKMQDKRAQKSAATTNEPTIMYIPVVVHVIHNGDAVGSDENITDAQVLSQITVLNQDFRKKIGTPGWNSNPVGADMEIEFVMAQTNPEGNLTNGIDRINMSTASWASINAIDTNLKPATSWDPTQYFNIWVCKYADTGEIKDLLGYAQFPSSSNLDGLDPNGGASNTDGLVIGYQYFGSATLCPTGNFGPSNNVYRYGRTATHEIGHCFGLVHINGDNDQSCQVNAADSYKDYCPDTPATKYYNYGCTPANSCPAAAGVDMIDNYMDYTDDTCMDIFTKDQKARVKTVMQNSPNRAELLTSTVAQAPAGTKDFKLLNGINLYPNPAHDVVNIAVTNGSLPDSFVIYNNLGQVITSAQLNTQANLTIDTAALSNGIYFIKINKGTAAKTLKFVKN